MSFTPTDEQAAVLASFRTGDNLVLEAAAGAGKTSTLKLLARDTSRRGIYFAYNRAIADEARRSFPSTVTCKTLHALARAEAMRAYPHLEARMTLPRQSARDVARILGIHGPARITPEVVLAPNQLANIAMETVARFTRSGDAHVTRAHMPHRPGLDDPRARASLAEVIGPYARAAWKDLRARDGHLRADHDHYRKLWALSSPRLPADFLLVDEAQDSDGLTMELVRQQVEHGAQIITVGDPNQAIYGWRGATSAMDAFGGTRLRLTQSFRFGHAIASEANAWLYALGTTMRVRGTDTIPSRIESARTTDAVLCRSNARAVETLMDLTDAGVRARIEGGGADVRRLAEAAQQLRDTGRTWHPELCAFTSWGQVQEYVENDAGGSDLATAVKLIDEWGPEAIIAAIDGMADARTAQAVISTAHKSKGLEWKSVRIATDFRKPDEGATVADVEREEAMLAYVAVTRAQVVLDNEGLAWIHEVIGTARPRRAA